MTEKDKCIKYLFTIFSVIDISVIFCHRVDTEKTNRNNIRRLFCLTVAYASIKFEWNRNNPTDTDIQTKKRDGMWFRIK